MIEAYKSTIKSKIENCVNSTYNKKILDVDCGDMDRTKLFCRNGNNVISIYIERPENMKGALRLVIVDGQYLPFTSNSFDLVVSFGVIEHVSDDSVFLSEVRIVLKRGGKILFRTPNKKRFSHRFLKVLGKEVEYPLRLEGGCIHLWEYTYEQLTSIFKKRGFKDINVYPAWVELRFTPLWDFKSFIVTK